VSGEPGEVERSVAFFEAALKQRDERIAEVERERDEARKCPGINDPRVAAINDAVTDFITRKDNPRLVCYHVPMIGCEVLMYAVGEGLPRVVTYRQFIRALERVAVIEADSSAVAERDALRAEVERLTKEQSLVWLHANEDPHDHDACPMCKQEARLGTVGVRVTDIEPEDREFEGPAQNEAGR
jgi:hypothetical protein